MIKVAITGNICSGKTFVLNILKTSGYHTFSSDEIIKNDIYKMTGVKDKISKNFPGTININGDINIDHLAKLIFGKVKKRKMLENIIYPHLTLLRKKFIYRSYLLGAKLSFYEVPLLFEKNLQSNFDSWASLVPEDSFDDIIITPTKNIMKKIRRKFTTITYPKGIGEKIISFHREINSDVLGVDHTIDLNWLLKNISSNVVLQGNLSPQTLLKGGEELVVETRKILELTKGRKHIFNVGHGIIKDTPVENVNKVLSIIRRF